MYRVPFGLRIVSIPVLKHLQPVSFSWCRSQSFILGEEELAVCDFSNRLLLCSSDKLVASAVRPLVGCLPVLTHSAYSPQPPIRKSVPVVRRARVLLSHALSNICCAYSFPSPRCGEIVRLGFRISSVGIVTSVRPRRLMNYGFILGRFERPFSSAVSRLALWPI